MTFQPTFDSYYAQLLGRRKDGHPTVREARLDYEAAIRSAGGLAAFPAARTAF